MIPLLASVNLPSTCVTTCTCVHVFVCVCMCVYVCLISHVQLFVIHGLYPTRLLCPWDSPGKNTGVGCHFLLQGIFLTQGLHLCLLRLLCLLSPMSPALAGGFLTTAIACKEMSVTFLSNRLSSLADAFNICIPLL